MPPWPLYELTTYAQPGWVVLSWGPKPVFYRRTVGPAGQIHGASVHVGAGPFPPDLLKYVAALLGEDASQLPVQAIERRRVRWNGAAELQQDIERIKGDVRERLALLAHKLRERGLLERGESSPFPHDATEIVLLDFRDDSRIPLSR